MIRYVRGIPVTKSISQGDAARRLAELLQISVSRARAIVSVARDSKTEIDDIERMITEEQQEAIYRPNALEELRIFEESRTFINDDGDLIGYSEDGFNPGLTPEHSYWFIRESIERQRRASKGEE